MKNIRKGCQLLAGALVDLTSLTASANTISPVLDAFTPGTSIQYGANLTSGILRTGDGFTIYDVCGFVSFGAVPAGWTPSTTVVGGFAHPGPLSTPDTGLLNVINFTYSGPDVEVSIGTLSLGVFNVNLDPTATLLALDDWSSKDHLLSGLPSDGHEDQILVPACPDGGSTMALLGVGIRGMGALRRRLNRS